MSLAFVMESFKFYRLRSRKTVQALFLLGFALNIAAFLLPVGDKDFSSFFSWLMSLGDGLGIREYSSSLLPDYKAASILTPGNLLYLLFITFMTILNIGISLVYAAAMNAGFDDYPPGQGIRQFAVRIPALALLALLMLPIYILSLMFFGLPFIYLCSALAFAPMFLIDRRAKLGEALERSMHATSGIRFQMVMSFFFATILISAPSNLLQGWFAGTEASAALIASFFASMKCLILGRLYALYYLYYSRSYPSRRLYNPFSPHDPTAFFSEVNRRGGDASDDGSDEEDDDDSGDGDDML